MRPPKHRWYEFQPFRLDTNGLRLFHQGELVKLSAKAVQLLVYLVDDATNVVKKDALMKELWPIAFVEEQNLTNLISDIRKALKEHSPDIEYIQTRPTVGYWFSVEPQPYDSPPLEQGVEQPFAKLGFFNDFIPMFD